MIYLSSSMKILGQYLEIGHDIFHHYMQFIFLNHSSIWRFACNQFAGTHQFVKDGWVFKIKTYGRPLNEEYVKEIK
jgi:hypothetical protein